MSSNLTMKKIKVSLIQMEIKFGNKEHNLKKAESLISIAVSQTNSNVPHIVCLPELFSTGYDLKNSQKHGEDIPGGKTTTLLKRIADKNSIIILASYIEKSEDKYYNTAVVINEKGSFLGKYRKIHLFPIYPLDETKILSTGKFLYPSTVFELECGILGVLICFDLRFPELSRKIALDGADLLIYLAEFPHPRNEIWTRLLQARAMENQIFVCGVNRVGTDPSKASFFGQSIIYDPNGSPLKEGSEKEEIISAHLDPSVLEGVRSSLPSLEHRQPEFY
ncbi:MAG: nitrilase-related carbon-nitrogen hydrolase [Candidatus Hodarchaeota archaeon]